MTQRHIPFWVGIALFFSNPMLIFGIIFTFLGGFAVYMLSDELFTKKNIKDSDPITQAVITRIEREETSNDDQTIRTYKYYYEFETTSGKKIKNYSEHHDKIAECGDILSVQYNPDNPEESRFTDFKEVGKGGLYILFLFPLIGIITLILLLVKVVKKVRIMRIGQTVYGTYEKKKATDSSVNGKRVYEMFFTFTAPNGKEYEIKTKTYRPEYLEDDEKELIIFDLKNPKNALPVDVLPQFAKQFIVKDDKNKKPKEYEQTTQRYIPLNVSLGIFRFSFSVPIQGHIPFLARILQFFPRTKVAMFGLVFTILGGLASSVFFFQMISLRKSIEDTDPVTQGVVIQILPTGTSINEKSVYEYFYEFKTASGEKVKSSSEYYEVIAQIGDTLSLQYNPDKPKESRFTEFDEVNYSSAFIFTLFFFVVGIMLLAVEKINAMS